MKVTLRQIYEGANKSLQEEFQTEYRIGKHMLQNPDFHEGVRAGMYVVCQRCRKVVQVFCCEIILMPFVEFFISG